MGIFYEDAKDRKRKKAGRKSKGWIGILALLVISGSIYWNLDERILNSNFINNVLDAGKKFVISNSDNHKSISDSEYVYGTLYEQIIEFNTYIKINASFRTQITSDDINTQYHKVIMDNPDIFWLTGGATIQTITSGASKTYLYDLNTSCDMNLVPIMKKKLDQVVGDIVFEARKYNSDYDKALYVHDVLVSTCKYDESVYYTSLFDTDTDLNTMAYSAYGCLVEHKAVCSGYAKAYQLIMNKLGIETGFVSGEGITSSDTGPHAWNYIKIDGNYCYVDVTWDDPVGYNSNEIRHDYFCISKDEISKDHIFDYDQFIPE